MKQTAFMIALGVSSVAGSRWSTINRRAEATDAINFSKDCADQAGLCQKDKECKDHVFVFDPNDSEFGGCDGNWRCVELYTCHFLSPEGEHLMQDLLPQECEDQWSDCKRSDCGENLLGEILDDPSSAPECDGEKDCEAVVQCVQENEGDSGDNDGDDSTDGSDSTDGDDSTDGGDSADGDDSTDGDDNTDGDDGTNGDDGNDGDDNTDGDDSTDGDDNGSQESNEGNDGGDGGDNGNDSQGGKGGEGGKAKTAAQQVIFQVRMCCMTKTQCEASGTSLKTALATTKTVKTTCTLVAADKKDTAVKRRLTEVVASAEKSTWDVKYVIEADKENAPKYQKALKTDETTKKFKAAVEKANGSALEKFEVTPEVGSTKKDEGSEGLSGGAVAGIVIGVLLGVGCLGGGVYYFMKQ